MNILSGKLAKLFYKKCCFCKKRFEGFGNSTWPIYPEPDGEKHRCCDDCNKNLVIAARKDRTLVMKIRALVGIDYTRYDRAVWLKAKVKRLLRLV